jgi:Uma2 family endonuclease
MSTSVKVTVEQFDEMSERGEFDDDPRRFELINGEVREMPAPNPPHEEADERLTRWSFQNLSEVGVRVRTQSSIGLPELDSVPVPDLIWLMNRDYSSRRPLASEVLLVIEVSDSTLSYDRNTKAKLYAAAGLADYWIVNIRGRCFEVLRDPGSSRYKSKTIFYPGEEIPPLALPNLAFPVSLIFPE